MTAKPSKPEKKAAADQKSASKDIYINDLIDNFNLKNKEILHPFKSLIKKELDVDLWPEFEFCKERKFRIDFAEPFLKIAIEIDGGIWMRGKSGHSSGSGIKRDQEKTTLLSQYGWSVLRFEPDEAMTAKTIEIVSKTIENKKRA